MTVYPIPALDSNYFWLLQPRPDHSRAYILDPGDEVPVLRALESGGLQLEAIVVTHKHHDHVDGIAPLLAVYPGLPVYGPESPAIPWVNRVLRGGDTLTLPDLTLEVLALPGHTPEHLGYIHRPATGPIKLFCGDTLFGAGCGRLLGGTAADLYASLQSLARLPPDTMVYCSHEYTEANLAFALAVEPGNPDLSSRQDRVKQRRAEGLPSVPLLLAEELATNPFLRCDHPAIRASAERWAGKPLREPVDVFTVLRLWKDRF